MAHMEPEYYEGICIPIDDGMGGFEYIPLDESDESIHTPRADEEELRGWFYRLSAPGYLDATDWRGPYESLGEAEAAMRDVEDVCPDCGESLDEDYELTCDCAAD